VKCTNKKSEISDREMGCISAAIVELLRRQGADRGLVVWYDPQKAYGSLAARLANADCAVLRFLAIGPPCGWDLKPSPPSGIPCGSHSGCLCA